MATKVRPARVEVQSQVGAVFATLSDLRQHLDALEVLAGPPSDPALQRTVHVLQLDLERRGLELREAVTRRDPSAFCATANSLATIRALVEPPDRTLPGPAAAVAPVLADLGRLVELYGELCRGRGWLSRHTLAEHELSGADS